MTQVLSFKMVSGEEVIAEVKSTQRSLNSTIDPSGKSDIVSYTLRRPQILQFQPVAPGKLGLAFVPWTLSNPDIESLTIPVTSVVTTYSPAKNVEQQYLEQMTGLAIASSF